MSENKIKDGNFITIQAFMVKDLQLKGNELLIYACIYGFSQTDGQRFTGSLQYLAEWTNSSKQTVITCLKSLVEKQFITKTEKIINGVKIVEYQSNNLNEVVKKFDSGSQKTLIPQSKNLNGGIQNSLPNNINNNISNNIDNKINNNKAASGIDTVLAQWVNNNIPECSRDNILDLLREWVNVRKKKRAANTVKAIELNLEKLIACATSSNMTVTDYLKEVICRGWAAFYEIGKWCNENHEGGRNEHNGNVEKSDSDRNEEYFGTVF